MTASAYDDAKNFRQHGEISRDYKQNQQRCRNGHDANAEGTISSTLLAFLRFHLSHIMIWIKISHDTSDIVKTVSAFKKQSYVNTTFKQSDLQCSCGIHMLHRGRSHFRFCSSVFFYINLKVMFYKHQTFLYLLNNKKDKYQYIY